MYVYNLTVRLEDEKATAAPSRPLSRCVRRIRDSFCLITDVTSLVFALCFYAVLIYVLSSVLIMFAALRKDTVYTNKHCNEF
jgi:hypothetical protein